MKKILLSISTVICATLIAGCAVQTVTTKGPVTTLVTTLPVDPVIRPLPLTADMNVSEQRVMGTAEGPAIEQERLTNAAIANALGQDPPTIDGPDVLVGMKVFTTQTSNGWMGNDMKVTVTGYPAHYKNFRTAEENDTAALRIIIPDGCCAGKGNSFPLKKALKSRF